MYTLYLIDMFRINAAAYIYLIKILETEVSFQMHIAKIKCMINDE